MDGASRAFASPWPYTLKGVEYRLRGRIARFYGEMEAEILSRRPNPLQVYRDNVGLFADNEDFQKDLYESAKREAFRVKSVTRIELFEWMQGLDGAIFCLWLSLRDNDPKLLTLEYVRTAVYDEADAAAHELLDGGMDPVEAATKAVTDTAEAIQKRISQAGGEDELGNSTGPSATTPTTMGSTTHSRGEG